MYTCYVIKLTWNLPVQSNMHIELVRGELQKIHPQLPSSAK